MFSPGTYAWDGPGKRFILFCSFAAAYLLLFILTSGNPFFLDKDILFSKIAFWLTENRFSPVLPNDIDPGYPPTMGYLLASVWSIFGRNLFVSHTVILPFTLGLIWQSYRLLSVLLPRKALLPSMLIILADSTLLAQSTLFSADMVLLFFFLFAVNGVIRNRRIGLALAATGLLFTHMRGSFLLAAVILFDQFRSENMAVPLSARFRRSLAYLPAILLFASWLLFHQATKGWTGYAPDSPWKVSLDAVNFSGILKNLLVVTWRIIDQGKVFVWAALVYFVIKHLKTKPETRIKFMKSLPKTGNMKRETRNNLSEPLLRYRKLKPGTRNDLRDLLLLLIFVMLTTLPSMLMYRNLSGHRYFMAINFLASATVMFLIFSEPLRSVTRKALVWIMLAGLLSGHFWVYPDKIAKGWDASLAYLPYPNLRSQMIRYLEQHHIPFDEVGTESPNTIVFKYIDLTDDDRSFERASLEKDHYVFWSNVFNMFTDDELNALKSEWTVEKEFRCMQVEVRLYRNPDR